MRHEKAGRLLELARMLAGTAEGLTLDDMAERLGVGRRTAERMRDAVRDVFPQLEEVDDPPTRRFRIPAGPDGPFQAPTGGGPGGPRPAAGSRPEGFSLQDYADESFGIYQDDTEDVVLRILPASAEGALRWRFHANQQVEPQPDGSVIVRFRASGMRELAWHLFTWGDQVQ